jgi:hypothetical protein
MQAVIVQLGLQTLLQRCRSGERLQFAPSNVQNEKTYRPTCLIGVH